MSLVRVIVIGLAQILILGLAAGAAQAAAHKMYSYDPANSETRHAAGIGIAFSCPN